MVEDNRLEKHTTGVAAYSAITFGTELRGNSFAGCTANVTDAGIGTIRDSGIASIANSATSVTIAIATQPDTGYLVAVTPQTFAEGAVAGSNRILSVTKTTSQITITLEAAPGAGNTNTFAWQITRQ